MSISTALTATESRSGHRRYSSAYDGVKQAQVGLDAMAGVRTRPALPSRCLLHNATIRLHDVTRFGEWKSLLPPSSLFSSRYPFAEAALRLCYRQMLATRKLMLPVAFRSPH